MCCMSDITMTCDPLGSILAVTLMCGDAATPMVAARVPHSVAVSKHYATLFSEHKLLE